MSRYLLMSFKRIKNKLTVIVMDQFHKVCITSALGECRAALARARKISTKSLLSGNTGGKGLFVDCGGYDGCSAIKFKLMNPEYSVVSFEPNPELWKYYTGLPTVLVKKAVWVKSGILPFTIDPIDGDGSSLNDNKLIDATGRVANNECKKIQVESVDLASFLKFASFIYDDIVLKLDVEGAEYEILENLIESDVIDVVSKLYCEFHGEKIGVDQDRHDRLVERLSTKLEQEEWDALDFSIHILHRENQKVKRYLEYFRDKIVTMI